MGSMRGLLSSSSPTLCGHEVSNPATLSCGRRRKYDLPEYERDEVSDQKRDEGNDLQLAGCNPIHLEQLFISDPLVLVDTALDADLHFSQPSQHLRGGLELDAEHRSQKLRARTALTELFGLSKHGSRLRVVEDLFKRAAVALALRLSVKPVQQTPSVKYLAPIRFGKILRSRRQAKSETAAGR